MLGYSVAPSMDFFSLLSDCLAGLCEQLKGAKSDVVDCISLSITTVCNKISEKQQVETKIEWILRIWITVLCYCYLKQLLQGMSEILHDPYDLGAPRYYLFEFFPVNFFKEH